MILDYYRIFYYVAQYKSFSKAADVMGNNQPNITRCMNILENLYPSSNPMISTSSNILYKDFATPRIVAFKAWQSPPLVKIPILLILHFLHNQKSGFFVVAHKNDTTIPILQL